MADSPSRAASSSVQPNEDGFRPLPPDAPKIQDKPTLVRSGDAGVQRKFRGYKHSALSLVLLTAGVIVAALVASNGGLMAIISSMLGMTGEQ